MNIYVAHPKAFDFQKELYAPIKDSVIFTEHHFVLPHDGSEKPFNSKAFFQNGCNLIISEVSYPATGLGIELGWAEMLGIPILCLYKKGMKPPGSAYVVTKNVVSYEDSSDMLQIIQSHINEYQNDVELALRIEQHIEEMNNAKS